jgi:hypothetical protein
MLQQNTPRTERRHHRMAPHAERGLTTLTEDMLAEHLRGCSMFSCKTCHAIHHVRVVLINKFRHHKKRAQLKERSKLWRTWECDHVSPIDTMSEKDRILFVNLAQTELTVHGSIPTVQTDWLLSLASAVQATRALQGLPRRSIHETGAVSPSSPSSSSSSPTFDGELSEPDSSEGDLLEKPQAQRTPSYACAHQLFGLRHAFSAENLPPLD